MSLAVHSKLLLAAVRGRGERYVKARDALLSSPPEGALALWRQAGERAKQWRVRLIARILLARLQQAELFDTTVRLVRGDRALMPGSPAGGEWGVYDRSMAICARGDTAVLAVLELLLATRVYNAGTEAQTLFDVLARREDVQAIEPLLMIVADPSRGEERTHAAAALGWFRSAMALPHYCAIVQNRLEPSALREACMTGLVLIEDARAVDLLVSIATGDNEPVAVRLAALGALVSLDARAAGPRLGAALTRTTEAKIAVKLLETLASLRVMSMLPVVHDVAAHHPHAHVRVVASSVHQLLLDPDAS